MNHNQILQILKQEMAAATGCTEPVAIAYASAKARAVLGKKPVRAQVKVSCNILKNAMGVGIPGTDMAGLEMAAALGGSQAVCRDTGSCGTEGYAEKTLHRSYSGNRGGYVGSHY